MENSALKFIGIESGFGKNNNSAYIELDDKFILIDCGFTVFDKLKEKFDFNKYKSINVIITHLHNDHAGSLTQFILYMWYIYNKKVIVISKCKNMEQYLKITGAPKEAYELLDDFENIEFIKTEHVKELDFYGFRARFNNKNILYTGDTKIIEPFLKYLYNLDELYIDVSKYGGVHIKFEDVIEKLRKIKIQGVNIYLMHIDDYEYINKINNGEFYFGSHRDF